MHLNFFIGKIEIFIKLAQISGKIYSKITGLPVILLSFDSQFEECVYNLL